MAEDLCSEKLKSLLEFLDYHRQQYVHQREVLDRWFRFYLIIIAAVLATIAAIFKFNEIRLGDHEQTMYFGLVSTLLFILGFAFFYMNTVQRANCVRYVRLKINPIEMVIWNSFKGLISSKPPEFTVNRFGADYAVGLVIAILNSAWFVGLVYFWSDKRLKSVCEGMGVRPTQLTDMFL